MVSTDRRSRRRLTKVGVALASTAAVMAILATGAVAAVGHWYVNGEPVGESPVQAIGHNEGAFHFGFNWGGVEFDAQCAAASMGGAVANPAGGGAGTLSNGSLVLSNCSVIRPRQNGCEVGSKDKGAVEWGTIRFRPLQGTAASDSISYLPQSGEVFFTLVIGGCTTTALNGEKNITGSAKAVAVPSAPGAYEFTKASSILHFGGQNAYMTGRYTLATNTGGVVTVGP